MIEKTTRPQGTYTSGEWLAACDHCGRLFLASKLKKQWDGIMACPEDFDFRQPQDMIGPTRGGTEKAIPWARPFTYPENNPPAPEPIFPLPPPPPPSTSSL